MNLKELDFKVIREEWLTIKLSDGSIIKLKPVLVKVFETDEKDPLTGEPILTFEGHNVITVKSPEKGPPSAKLPDPSESLKMPKEEVEISEIIDPGWNLYELENGRKVKTKTIITNVYKIKGLFDQHGNPYYVVRSQMVVSASELRLLPSHSFERGRSIPSEQSLFSEYYYPQPSTSAKTSLKTDLPTKLEKFKNISEVLEALKPQIKVKLIKLTDDRLVPLDEKLFVRKKEDGRIEIFEVLE